MTAAAPLIDGQAASPELDAWRAAYQQGAVSWDDHRRLYERLAVDFPEQNYYDAGCVSRFLGWAQPASVVELGGWDGALAAEMLVVDDRVVSWVNHEVVAVPQVCTDGRYRMQVGDRPLWETAFGGDAFVASHVLEHLTVADMEALIGCLADADVGFVYADVPLTETPTDWMRSTTTHVLTWSIGEFDEAWRQAGYAVAWRGFRDGAVPSHVRWYGR